MTNVPPSTRRARQRGAGFAGWFMVIVLVFGAASVGLRTVPAYLDHGIIDDVIVSVLEDDDVGSLGRGRFIDRVERQLKLNNIRDLDLPAMIEFEQGRETIVVDLDYEVRRELFANVDLVLSFSEHYEKVLDAS